MHYDGDAFISYAHLDNQELIEGRKGWVANLHRALEVRVGQLLGKQPHIWRDPKLTGNDFFAETLVERLRKVAVLVSVVSPRYLKSEWTRREFEEFWKAAELQGGVRQKDKARVFKVLKTPVSLDATPPELRSLLGYEFFKVDPETGKVRELDEVFGPEAQREFWLKLDDLAHDICGLLEMLEGDEAHAEPAADRGVVFLAETTSDVREQRETLKRDLQQQGYTVVPSVTLPPVASEVKAVVRDDLARSDMSIHMIGRNYSVVPEGGIDSLLEIQHDLAVERAASGGFSRIVWLPPGLEVADERQRKVIERLRLDPRAQDHADLLETFFEDLRTVVREWLDRIHAPAPAAAPPAAAAAAPGADTVPRLYFIHDQRDADHVGPWSDFLFDQKLEVVHPIFVGDETEIREYHEETLCACDGVLIMFGAANECWLRRKLREVQKSPGFGRTKPAPLVGICLVPPKTAEKERFRTHEAVVIPQWDGLDAGSLGPFISRLKGGGEGRPS